MSFTCKNGVSSLSVISLQPPLTFVIHIVQAHLAANPSVEHILVAPASLFVDSVQMICSGGPYKMYRIVEAADTDDFEYYLDPPIYAKGLRLGCDGKAGLAMQTVALNCRPLGNVK